MPPMFDMITGTVRRRMVDLIAQRPGITNRELSTLLYADRADGGPMWAHNVISVLVFKANKQLAPHGYRIKSTLGPGAAYRMVTT
jgi:hypothetical protein